MQFVERFFRLFRSCRHETTHNVRTPELPDRAPLTVSLSDAERYELVELLLSVVGLGLYKDYISDTPEKRALAPFIWMNVAGKLAHLGMYNEDRQSLLQCEQLRRSMADSTPFIVACHQWIADLQAIVVQAQVAEAFSSTDADNEDAAVWHALYGEPSVSHFAKCETVLRKMADSLHN